jgi:hypothetical protein
VVPHLEHLGAARIEQLVLDRPPGVARQQKRVRAVPHAHHERIVVLRFRPGLGVRRRSTLPL